MQGVDRGTFSGAILAERLQKEVAEKQAEARTLEIDRLSKAPGDNSDRLEQLRTERSAALVQAAQSARNETQAGFAKQEGVISLNKALSELARLAETEAAKRREVTDALSASKLALDQFNSSLDSKRADAEGGLIGLARKIKAEGGTLPLGLDNEERLKSAELYGDVTKFNELTNQFGFTGKASGGEPLGVIRPSSPFEQGLKLESDKLEDAIRKTQNAFHDLPDDLNLFRVSLQKTITDLAGKASSAAEPGAGIRANPTASPTASPKDAQPSSKDVVPSPAGSPAGSKATFAFPEPPKPPEAPSSSYDIPDASKAVPFEGSIGGRSLASTPPPSSDIQDAFSQAFGTTPSLPFTGTPSLSTPPVPVSLTPPQAKEQPVKAVEDKSASSKDSAVVEKLGQVIEAVNGLKTGISLDEGSINSIVSGTGNAVRKALD